MFIWLDRNRSAASRRRTRSMAGTQSTRKQLQLAIGDQGTLSGHERLQLAAVGARELQLAPAHLRA